EALQCKRYTRYTKQYLNKFTKPFNSKERIDSSYNFTDSFIHHEIHGAYNRVHVNHRSGEDLLGLKDKASNNESISNLTHEAREFAIGMAIVGSVQFFFGALFVVSLNYAAQSQVGKCLAMQENKAYAAAEALAEDVFFCVQIGVVSFLQLPVLAAFSKNSRHF
ncbi:hypothetical protein C0J52_11490, partial [Blattella germanica]